MFLPVNAVVHQANVLRVLARNVGGTKNNIPQEKHIPKIAGVVANAVFVAQGMVGPDGFVDLTGAGVLGCQGLDAYLSGTVIERLPYAKP